MKHKLLNIKIMNHMAELLGYVDFRSLAEDDQDRADTVSKEIYKMSLNEKYKLDKQLEDNE